MTKNIRVENADTSSYKVVVETWEKSRDGAPDLLVTTQRLDYPTAMATVAIHSTRYLVIKEAAVSPALTPDID